jgi:tRNA(Ile)-lysidine synthase
MDLLKSFKNYIKEEHLFHKKEPLLLAISGGLDSVALMELCRLAGYHFEIAHCNFGLRGDDSKRDEAFVVRLAAKYHSPIHVKHFDTHTYAAEMNKSIEEAARDLRYEWFHSLLDTGDIGEGKVSYIVTAHHADDNIETVLMNFFRGTGILGLRGMMPKQGKILRPLLFARRSELEIFAQQHGLKYVTDHTNLENAYTRNYFRNTLIPLVASRFPAAERNVLNNIQRFREVEILYRQSVQLHKSKLIEIKGNEVHIPILKLQKAGPVSTILYEIIRDYGFTAHQTTDAVDLLASETGKYIQSATHKIIRNRAWLIVVPRQAGEAAHVSIEAGDEQVVFPGGSIKLERSGRDQFSKTNDGFRCPGGPRIIEVPLAFAQMETGRLFYPVGHGKKEKAQPVPDRPEAIDAAERKHLGDRAGQEDHLDRGYAHR